MSFSKMFLLGIFSFLLSIRAYPNLKSDNHIPIGHCYHWLDESGAKYLTYKYSFQKKNNGELTFYTDPSTSNGAVAGPGLYCGKTPGDSYSYGNRAVRVDFVDDVVMLDATTGKQTCGHRGDFYQDAKDCQSKPWDIKFYGGGGRGNYAWYVIRNPQAVASWSANSDQLIADLNAEKPFEPGAYSVHADNTINLMRRDVAIGANAIVYNQNARLSIVKILEDPSKLAQIPPLTVIALVHVYKGDDIDKKKKLSVYASQMKRALEDTKLTFQDFMNSAKLDNDIEKAFVNELKFVQASKLDKLNPVVVLQAFDHFESVFNLSSQDMRLIWKTALLSDSPVQSILDSQLKVDGLFAKEFEASLPSLNELKGKLKDFNLIPMLGLLNLYIQDGKSAPFKALFKFLAMSLLEANGTDFLNTYATLTNEKLNKEAVFASIIQPPLFLSPEIQKIDLLTLGLALDQVADKYSKAEVLAIQKMILALPYLATQKPSYQLLDQLENKKLKVPSFFDQKTILLKIIERSIAERKILKNPTNTYRMVASGIFSYFNSFVRTAKEPADKDAASIKAGDDLLDLVAAMTSDIFEPYRYVTLQNASFFYGKAKFDSHPIEHVFLKYKKGDTRLDQIIENVFRLAYDGSLFQYYIFNYKDDKNILPLFKGNLSHLLDPEFDKVLKKESFISSQAEKKVWHNIVGNKNYSPFENARVPSTLCHVVDVLKRSFDKLDKMLSKSELDKTSTWIKSMEGGHCKKPKD